MKPKNFEKKLMLNKRTISHIDDAGMAGLQAGDKSDSLCGGYTCQIPTCNSCYATYCSCPTETCMITVCPYEPC